MQLEKILEIAVKAGEIVLVSGAEILRVEITIEKILEAYEAKGECFVLSSGIFVTVVGNDGETITRIKRINSHSTNLARLEAINNFSRQMVEAPFLYEDALRQLLEIEKIAGYSFPTHLFAASTLSFVFIFFFNGTVREAIVACIIAAVVFFVQAKLFNKYFFMFLEYFLASILSALLCGLSAKFFPSLDIIKLIIGAIMPLVPGSSITNAMKDALNGDIVSSTYKFSETAFIAVAICSGIALTLSFVLRW